MVFSSMTFLFLFLPITFGLYCILNNTMRNVFLLAASLFFYAWGEPLFVFVMLTSIAINYSGALFIDRMSDGALRRVITFITISTNLGLLLYYKYFSFAVQLSNEWFRTSFAVPQIFLPIGISFFTFQGMSYVIDVYRKTVPAQKNPLYIALYISLFPQLIAGPIVRYIDIHKQLKKREINLESTSQGMKRFIVGLSKKVMIANVLGSVADKIFNHSTIGIDAPTAWIGAFCYTAQIYFDFSGYSDMAIGLGKMFGFTFLENFNYPYIAHSMTEFWRRWHISLSTWFRDYLYIPLGGNRKGNVYLNLLIVFAITGLWHGAALSFLVWGLWHGLFLILERPFYKKKLFLPTPRLLQHGYTMLVVVVGWILFRSPTLLEAISFLKTMFGFSSSEFVAFGYGYYLDGHTLFIALLAILFSTPFIPTLKQHFNDQLTGTIAVCLKPFIYLSLASLAVIHIVNSQYNPFIYFRF